MIFSIIGETGSGKTSQLIKYSKIRQQFDNKKILYFDFDRGFDVYHFFGENWIDKITVINITDITELDKLIKKKFISQFGSVIIDSVESISANDKEYLCTVLEKLEKYCFNSKVDFYLAFTKKDSLSKYAHLSNNILLRENWLEKLINNSIKIDVDNF